MKILYLTTESFFKEPIIKSQVKTLLEIITNNHIDCIQFTLLTFDDIESKSQKYNFNSNFEHYIIRNYGHLINILSGIIFTLKNAKKFDIIHVRSYPMMIAGLLAKLFYRKKLIFDPRGLYSEELLYVQKNKFVIPIFHTLEKLSCKYSDFIVVVSKPFKEFLIEKYKIKTENVIVVTTFSTIAENDLSKNEPVIDIRKTIFNDSSVILFVYSGSIEKWQMIDIVVHFFALISKNIANARFVFLSKSKLKFIDYLFEKLPSDKYFVESTESDILPLYLSQCDYSVIFRDDNIINKVSAPIKIKDYLLSGLPLIITDNIGDSSEFIKENNLGYVVENTSTKEMLKIIENIKENKIVFDKKQIVNITKDHFHVNVIAEKYYNLYQKLFIK